MSTDRNILIYIDNFGAGEDQRFANSIKDRLARTKIEHEFEVVTFLDLDPPLDPEEDPNNESNTISALRNADVVVPIVTPTYIGYVLPEFEELFNEIIESNSRTFLPILLVATDWSNHDWMVKSQLMPEDAKAVLDHTDTEIEKITDSIVQTIRAAIIKISKKSSYAAPSTAQPQDQIERTVFISHDHDDADFAELLKLRLEKEGIKSWLDTERLKIGQDWREEIDQGIVNSAALIAIMTPEARKSEYVTYEWAFAWGKNKVIFPLMLKQTQLHPRLESLQYLNFTNRTSRPWEELVESIKKQLESVGT